MLNVSDWMSVDFRKTFVAQYTLLRGTDTCTEIFCPVVASLMFLAEPSYVTSSTLIVVGAAEAVMPFAVRTSLTSLVTSELLRAGKAPVRQPRRAASLRT